MNGAVNNANQAEQDFASLSQVLSFYEHQYAVEAAEEAVAQNSYGPFGFGFPPPQESGEESQQAMTLGDFFLQQHVASAAQNQDVAQDPRSGLLFFSQQAVEESQQPMTLGDFLLQQHLASAGRGEDAAQDPRSGLPFAHYPIVEEHAVEQQAAEEEQQAALAALFMGQQPYDVVREEAPEEPEFLFGLPYPLPEEEEALYSGGGADASEFILALI